MTNCYKILPKARDDLEEIWLYGVQHWGLARAESYLEGLEQSFQLIAKNPELFRGRHEFSPPVRIHHYKKHLLVYDIADKSVLILRVLHKRMEIEQKLDD